MRLLQHRRELVKEVCSYKIDRGTAMFRVTEERAPYCDNDDKSYNMVYLCDPTMGSCRYDDAILDLDFKEDRGLDKLMWSYSDLYYELVSELSVR